MLAIKMRTVGWTLLIGGGTGTIISALIGSDWPMYSFIILSSVGAIFLIGYKKAHKA